MLMKYNNNAVDTSVIIITYVEVSNCRMNLVDWQQKKVDDSSIIERTSYCFFVAESCIRFICYDLVVLNPNLSVCIRVNR